MPRGTLDPGSDFMLSHTGLLPSMASAFQPLILLALHQLAPVRNPDRTSAPPVWAPPRSLATTCGITFVFFSCGYLDVSVPHVSPCYAMCSHNSTRALAPRWVPPFGHLRIYGYLRLPAAFRSLSRPSSASGA